MSIGSENLDNGAAKPERFTGKYRGARRDGTLAPAPSPADDLDPRQGPPLRPVDQPDLPSLEGLSEPVYRPVDWPDPARGEPLVGHPLLRGLLLELPPRGASPAPQWLDRWFEAARAILELLYVQDAADRSA
jgi:hypothetical protein